MLINKDMKMADVIHLDHHLLHVINRFNIQLGFEDKSVETVCCEYQVNTDFFLEIVNTYHDPTYFPLKNLQRFKPTLLIDYLQKTHHYYLGIKIPEIEQYINQLTLNKKIEPIHSKLLADFFQSYKSELTTHITKEEQRVYPYVKRLEIYLSQIIDKELIIKEIKDYSIMEYEQEHDDVEAKLYDLKNIIIKYLPSPTDSSLFNKILHDLFELERDLNNHGRFENLILVPIVEKMEKDLLQKIKKS
jgi:regulator of cell morphogenesis and NO signaling